MSSRREIRSVYIEWAKLRSKAQFTLSSSDVMHYPLPDMHVRIEDLSLSPPSGYGYRPLLERLGARANVPVDSVVHAQGTSMANHLAMAALLEPGDEVLLEEPGYEAIFSAAQYLGARIRRFPRKLEAGFQVDPREIERAISPRTRMIAITNLHNPSGVRTPDSALKMVGQIARSVGAHVLVDEVYLEMCFDSTWRIGFSSRAKLRRHKQPDESLRPHGVALRLGVRGARSCGAYVETQRPLRRKFSISGRIY